MLTDLQMRLALIAANTIWAIGKGKVPEHSAETALLGLTSVISEIDDEDLKELLIPVATQLHAHARLAQLDREIAERDAERIKLKEVKEEGQALKNKSSAVYEYFSGK
jgi:hypothetical protein